MTNVDFTRVPLYFHKYIQLVPIVDLNKGFLNHQSDLKDLLVTIPGDKWEYRYAEGKWSIKEMVQHIIDAERIFCYRALTFARKDKNQLPSFDENLYNASSAADSRNSSDLIEELSIVQQASALLFRSFNKEQLNENGVAGGNNIYVAAIGYIIIGHSLHHIKLLKERYL